MFSAVKIADLLYLLLVLELYLNNKFKYFYL